MSDTESETETEQRKNKIAKLYSDYSNILLPIFGFITVYGLLAGGYQFTDMPQWVFIYGNYVVTVVLIAYLSLDKVIKHLSNMEEYWLLSTNFIDETNSIFDLNLYRIGEETKKNAEYEGGKPYETPNNFILSEGYNKEENIITGHWLDQLSNYQLIKYKSALREAKTDLTDKVIKSAATEATAETAVINAQTKLMQYITQQINSKSQIEGSKISQIVRETISENKLEMIAEESLEEVEEGEETKTLEDVINENPEAFEDLDIE